MRQKLLSLCFLSSLTAVSCLSQDSTVVRIGVAVMENYAGRSVPGNVEQARLVKALNQMKPDKKTHLKIEAIPLNAASKSDGSEEAQQKKYQYVVYTRLTELRGQQDPYQHQPGTIETNPNSQWGSHNQSMDPEYRATVEYKLVQVTSGREVSGAPFSTQQNGNEIDTVSQIMDRIALAVADQVKKAPPPMRE